MGVIRAIDARGIYYDVLEQNGKPFFVLSSRRIFKEAIKFDSFQDALRYVRIHADAFEGKQIQWFPINGEK